MKAFFRIMSAVFIMAGSIIGAGFATGKEIYVFFYGGNSYVVGCICAVLFFVAFVSVSVFAKKNDIASPDKMFKKLYGKASVISDGALMLCFFLVLSTMIAAANLCLSDLFGIDERSGIFGIFTTVLCALVLKKGMKGMKIINCIAVPLIVLFIFFMCVSGAGAKGDAKSVSCFAYVCFNAVMMSGVLTSLAKTLSVKENITASIITSILLGALITMILARLNDPIYKFVPMPLISIAKGYGEWLYVAASVILYLSILTTVLSAAFPLVSRISALFPSKNYGIWTVMAVAAAFSYVGFDAIIGYAYPIISVFGIIILVSIAFKSLRKKSVLPANDFSFKQSDRAVH